PLACSSPVRASRLSKGSYTVQFTDSPSSANNQRMQLLSTTLRLRNSFAGVIALVRRFPTGFAVG
ncbi:hypothetical protein BRN33_20120, partial [Xanthomonas oryzae pv. oryzae]